MINLLKNECFDGNDNSLIEMQLTADDKGNDGGVEKIVHTNKHVPIRCFLCF